MTDTNDSVSQRIPHDVKLKFSSEHIQPILDQEKKVTLRVGLESDDYPVGHPLLMIDESGDWFAEAEVVDRGYTTVEMAAKMEWDAHRNYDSTEELLEELRGYYPDEEIGPCTRVDIIEWGELW